MADILSVGIDIGTSTTQVIFSRLQMENTSGYFSVPKVSIVDKEVVYKSKVYTTPLLNPVLIDGDGVQKIVQHEFEMAGYTPADTETGAVIITGESARKENAAVVLEKLSGFAGDFVVSTAGPDLESIIAGKGSGAWRRSTEEDCIAVNLDVGGGTSNIVAFDGGETVGKGCVDVGGRLIRLNTDLVIERVSPPAEAVARAVGVRLEPGQKTTLGDLRKITDKMADLLAQVLGLIPEEPLLKSVRTPGSDWFIPPRRIDYICFSGGVADCMEQPDLPDIPFGDIGVLLGRSIRENAALNRVPHLDASETIRATVVGAGTYTTSISGSTIDYAKNLLPLKNIPVLKPDDQCQTALFSGKPSDLADQLRWFREQSGSDRVALAMSGRADPDYTALKNVSAAVAEAWDKAMPADAPILLILENDIAKALGFTLRSATRRPVLAIDSVHVDQNDYVDLGRPLMDGMVIPVVVKTLIFG